MANFFPKSANTLPAKLLIILGVLTVTVVAGVTYYFTPKYTRVGYMPTQPVAYNHYLHAEQLGIDCRYCHTYVDQSGHANVPDAATCMNCHSYVKSDSPQLEPIRVSYETGEPVEWVRVHAMPDYVFFNHAVHVNRGVSCVDCHGNVNEMEVVWHDKPMSMAWCLDCHRNPEEHIRPLEHVYDLNWTPENAEAHAEWAREHVVSWNVNPPQSCSGCHR
ncbi:MAG: cytochrome c3 family protein [Opitutales bacterium]|nr:cytochrome c3 family protein [Opitutales bacterium]